MSTPRPAPAQRFAALKQQLSQLEYFCTGTVLARKMKCGQPCCACHADPTKRHGPYWEWTYKVQAKTVNIRLSFAAGPLYQAATQQHRKLKRLLRQLEKLSRAALAAAARKAESESATKRKTRTPATPH